MTKEEAIEIIDEKCIGSGTSSDIFEACNIAIEALKRDDPEVEFREHLKNTTFCGYSFTSLLIFADACRINGITQEELDHFRLSAENAFNYAMSKMEEAFNKKIRKELS